MGLGTTHHFRKHLHHQCPVKVHPTSMTSHVRLLDHQNTTDRLSFLCLIHTYIIPFFCCFGWFWGKRFSLSFVLYMYKYMRLEKPSKVGKVASQYKTTQFQNSLQKSIHGVKYHAKQYYLQVQINYATPHVVQYVNTYYIH